MNIEDRKELFEKDVCFIENCLKNNIQHKKIAIVLTHMCPLKENYFKIHSKNT